MLYDPALKQAVIAPDYGGKRNVSTKGIKQCIMCFLEIDVRAKKCPHCRSLQTQLGNLEAHPWFVFIAIVVLFGIFGIIFYNAAYRYVDLKDIPNALQVEVESIDYNSGMAGNYVACLGTISNASEYQWSRLRFEVRFLDSNGQLIDTFSKVDSELLIPASGKSTFRVRGEAQGPEPKYSSCNIRVLDAYGSD